MNRCFLLFFMLLAMFISPTQLSVFTTSLAHAEDRNTTANDLDTNKENLSQIMQSILENQEKILIDIEAEQKHFLADLTQEIGELATLRQSIYNDFSKLYKVYWLNQEHPTEITLVAEQLNRFIYQITDLYTPLEHKHTQVKLRLQQLNNLIDNLETMHEPEARAILERASKFKKAYTGFDSRLERKLAVTKDVLKRISDTYTKLEEKMPTFWLNYYTTQTIDLSTSYLAWSETEFLGHATDLIQSALLREVPTTPHAWLTLFTTAISIILPFMLLNFIVYKSIKKWTPEHKTLFKTAIPWILLGIILQYTSWHGGNRYQIIYALGAFMLCFGQIRLAWQLLCLNRKENPHKSPLSVVFTLFVASVILLNLTDITVIFSVIWVLFLVGMLYYIHKIAPTIHLTLSRLLIRGLFGVIVISIFLAILQGLVHLSFFIIIIYMCLMIGIHQAEACIHATSLLQKRLPQSGASALIYGLLLAIAIPILLVISLISPISWLLTFAGGEFLIDTLRNFNFNVGELSLNVLHILGIASAFYLVQSIINVSSHYIDNTWSHERHSSLASLSTPIKTIIFFGFWGIFILFVLQTMGFNLTSLAVIGGGLSVGVGLGMQDLVKNTFSGFALIFGRNIREGDLVDVGTVQGIVQKVSLRATKIRTFDNAIIFVPNSEFMAKSFINWTHNGHKARCNLLVGVAYNSNLELVKNAILEALSNDKRISHDPEPQILLLDFAASSLNFEIRFWIYNVIDRKVIVSDIRYAINTQFKKHGIEIPFPQTDIHLNPSVIDAFTQNLNKNTAPRLNAKPSKRRVRKAVPNKII